MTFRHTIAAFITLLVFSPISSAEEQVPAAIEMRVLLVGNSIIYMNNTPAILMSIAESNGRPMSVDMYAKGGAQIVDLVDDSAFHAVLVRNNYDAVVFHDRGGNAMCASSRESERPEMCQKMRKAHHWLVDRVRENGAVPYLLGTYQGSLEANRFLSEGERQISMETGTKYINVTTNWVKGREALPHLDWLHEDGMHPGRALSVLLATQIYRSLTDSWPESADITIISPLFQKKTFPDFLPRHENTDPSNRKNEVLSRENFEALLELVQANQVEIRRNVVSSGACDLRHANVQLRLRNLKHSIAMKFVRFSLRSAERMT